MTSSLRLDADPAARRNGDLASVVASLPASLRWDSVSPDLLAVSGVDGWTARASRSVENGIKGILVVDPIVEDAGALDAAASRAGVPVVIDRPLAGNPLLRTVVPIFADPDRRDGLLESRVVIPASGDLESALLDQLALVRAAAAAVESAAVVIWTSAVYVIEGRIRDGRQVQLTGIRTNAQPRSGWVRILGRTGEVELAIPDPGSARPAHATITTADGATLLPTLFETSHRAAWRRLRDLARAGHSAPDLRHFRADVGVVASLSGGR